MTACARRRRGWVWLLPVAAALAAGGCGSGGASGMNPPPVAATAPAIAAQPTDQSVPMGLSATFAVAASGPQLQYQWLRDGAIVAGATASSYQTPPTGFADTGARFTVSVSNAAGTLVSGAAVLTVTARAPRAGDLRFQRVDAPETVNGWGSLGGLSTNLLGRQAESYSPSVGTPFYVGSAGNCSVPPVTNGTGCTWFFTETPYAANPDDVVAAAYGSDSFDNFEADLANVSWPGFNNGLSPARSAAVVTSLDLEPASALFGLSWAQSAQQTGFLMQQNSVAPADLQTAATAEGAAGRVITAVSGNGSGQITYLAYAWLADSASVYEARVVFTPTRGAVAAATALAAGGYILTASGQADASGNIVLVGTRLEGDTLPRPFRAAQSTMSYTGMQQQGYAPVGVIIDLTQSDPYTYLGER
jgi:hypothetical protein